MQSNSHSLKRLFMCLWFFDLVKIFILLSVQSALSYSFLTSSKDVIANKNEITNIDNSVADTLFIKWSTTAIAIVVAVISKNTYNTFAFISEILFNESSAFGNAFANTSIGNPTIAKMRKNNMIFPTDSYRNPKIFIINPLPRASMETIPKIIPTHIVNPIKYPNFFFIFYAFLPFSTLILSKPNQYNKHSHSKKAPSRASHHLRCFPLLIELFSKFYK